MREALYDSGKRERARALAKQAVTDFEALGAESHAQTITEVRERLAARSAGRRGK